MTPSIKEFVELTTIGNDVFVRIRKPAAHEEPIPYGSVTEYIDSLTLKDVNFQALKTAFKRPGADPVLLAKRLSGLGYTSRFHVEISDDNMSCRLILMPPREREQQVGLDSILAELKKKGVVHGIERETIKKAIADKVYKKRIIAARGTPPVPGRDTGIVPLVPCGSRLIDTVSQYSSEELYDTFELLKPVKKGDSIARIEPATPGSWGADIFNNKIPAVKGEPKEITSPTIEIQGDKIIAKINGRPLRSSYDSMEVEPLMVLRELTNETFTYEGSLKILGDVESCPLIRASGDIEIHGVASDTSLNAGRNIIVHENFLSNLKKPVIAGGDFVGRNVSYVHITAENILILSTAINSELNSYRSIYTLDKDGCILGGHTRAGLSVHSRAIGSEKEIATCISVATPPVMTQFRGQMVEYYAKKIEEIKNNIAGIQKKIALVEKMQREKGVRNPAAYNILRDNFRGEMERYEKEKSSLLLEVVKVKDPKFMLMTADISADIFYPNTTLEMGRGRRKISERREKLVFYLKDGNIFTRELRGEI